MITLYMLFEEINVVILKRFLIQINGIMISSPILKYYNKINNIRCLYVLDAFISNGAVIILDYYYYSDYYYY